MNNNSSINVAVYLDDGRVFEYNVESPAKAREHSHAIITTGYRHVFTGGLEHYPPHRILKVKVTGEIDTMYPDTIRGT